MSSVNIALCQMFRFTHNKTYLEKLELLMEPEASAAALEASKEPTKPS